MRRSARRWWRWLARSLAVLGGGLALIALGLVLATAIHHNLPYTLPAPSGPYPVARTRFDWTDASRPDPLTTPPAAQRSFTAWLWYPTVPGRHPAPYLPAPWRRALEGANGLGGDLRRGYAHLITHASDGGPVRPGDPLPVLLFMPGLGPQPTDYTVLLEDLASRGYAVLALTPAGSAGVDLRPDGQVVTASARGNPPEVSGDFPAQDAAYGPVVRVWAQDVQFAARQLAALDRTGPFRGRLKLDHLGLFGHSLGGAAALLACPAIRTCAAVADLDGNPYGGSAGAHEPVPVLELLSGGSCADALCVQAHARLTAILTRGAPGSAQVRVRGAEHFNFSDLALTTPLWLGRQLGMLGSIAPERALALTRATLAAFFAGPLRAEPTALPSAAELRVQPR